MKSKLKMPLTTYIKTYYNVLTKIEIFYFYNAQKISLSLQFKR
jgi:hypothetical protein